MKIIKTIFKVVLGLILALLLVIAGAGYYTYRNPEKVWALVQEKFLPKDLKISWKQLRVHAGHDHGRLFNPYIAFEGLCIQKKSPLVDVCLDEIHVTSSMSFEKLTKPQIAIYEATAISNYANVFQPNSKPQEKSPEMNFYEMLDVWRKRLNSWSGYLAVQQVNIDMKSFELRSETSSPILFGAKIGSLNLLELAQYEFSMKRKPAFEVESKGQIAMNHFLDGEAEFGNLAATFEAPKAKIQVEKLILQWNRNQQVEAQLQSAVDVPQKAQVKIDLKALLDSKNLKVDATSVVSGLKKPFDHIKPVVTTFRIPQEKGRLWPREKADYTIAAFVPLFFVEPKAIPEVEKSCHCDLPEHLKVNAHGTASLQNYFSDNEGFLADTNLEIESMNNELFSTQTVVKGEVLRKENKFKIEPYVDSQINILSFQKMVGLLKTLKVIIPAPLNVLDGKIHFAMKGPLENAEEIWKIPYLVTVDLAGGPQRVNVETNGFVNVALEKRAVDSNIVILVKQLVLQLPDLDPVFGAPKVATDQRFELQPPVPKKPKKKNQFSMRFAVQIKTADTKSIQLLFKLADPSIPIGIQMDYQSGETLKGKISLSKFNVEYLRRKSTVEKFDLALNEPKGNFPLKGRFRVDQSPYKIYIDVLGSLKAPQVVLSSEPYLDRSDIISVLLYGRVGNQLVSADSKVVGSFDAALADRAIGLLGMWAFASTPIQSFSYNQLSKQYTASLKVSDDTTLAVGTNWEEATSLELQKRLSDRWMISASLEPTEQDQQTRKLQLQWEDRF
jgi:hypothetical protein